MKKELSASMEDYLEGIFVLNQSSKVVRVRDIAEHLGVRMASVTDAVKNLKKHGYVDHEKYEYVELTAKGTANGREIYRRHQVLLSFLSGILKINPKTAAEDACKMEHAISSATMNKLVAFIKKIEKQDI